MGKDSARGYILFNISEFILEKNPTLATIVGNPSVIARRFPSIREFIPERNPINVANAEKPFDRILASPGIREFTLEKNRTYVTIVE